MDALFRNRVKIPHTFVIHTYTKPTQCHYCKKMLVGVFKQVCLLFKVSCLFTFSNQLFVYNLFFFTFSGVPFPPSNKLTMTEVFDSRTNKPRPEILRQHFIVEGKYPLPKLGPVSTAQSGPYLMYMFYVFIFRHFQVV